MGDRLAARTDGAKRRAALLELPLMATLPIQRVQVAQVRHHALFAILKVEQQTHRAHIAIGQLELIGFRLEGKVGFDPDARGAPERDALDGRVAFTRHRAGGDLQGIGTVEGTVGATVPMRDLAQHGLGMARVGARHRLQRVLVIADQTAPAVHAGVEVVEIQHACEWIVARETRVAVHWMGRGHGLILSKRRRRGRQ